MKRFDRVREILDEAVKTKPFVGAHGTFWRGLTLGQFVSRRVFGLAVVTPGDAENSTIIQALEGRPPFGSDLEPAPPGATFRRMPAGLPPVPADQIAFIRQWITDDCPDDVIEDLQPAVTPEQHNAFWREFDDWAMFSATPEVQNAEGGIFSAFPAYQVYARDVAHLDAWMNVIQTGSTLGALELLSTRQWETVTKHYGDTINLGGLLEGFELFGRGELPSDPLRPQHPQHQMDGQQMWFIWGSFVDACLRIPISPEAWHVVGRGVLLGLLNDGVFRERFVVSGFTKDEAGKGAMRELAANLGNEELLAEFRKRLVESELFA